MAKYLKKRQTTQHLIEQTALKLAEKKGVLKLTVSDIIKTAHLNRKTFYRYYQDKFQLFEVIENRILQQMKTAHFQVYRFKTIQDAFQSQILSQFLDVFARNRKIILLLTGNHGDPRFNSQMNTVFHIMVSNVQKKLLNNSSDPKVKLELLTPFITSAFWGLIKYWLNHYDQYSKDDLIRFIYKLNLEKSLRS